VRELRPLAVLTTSYPNAGAPGAGDFVQEFCRACVRGGLRVEVLCPEPAASVAAPAAPGIRGRYLAYARPRRWQFLSAAPGAPELLATRPWRWAAALAFGGRATLAVASGAAQRRWCALVSHWLLPSSLAGVIGAPGLPHVGIAHGSDVHLLERLRGGRHLARRILGGTHRLAFVSTPLRHRFAALVGPTAAGALDRRSVVQPMGVAPLWAHRGGGASRAELRARLGLPEGPVVLWMGRFVPLKAPARALRAVAAMSGATLLMAGEGPLEAELRRLSAPLGRRVRLVGFAQGARKAELLAAADVLVHTATTLADGRSDSQPVTVLEALGAGLPVVATAVGGLPWLGLAEADGLTLVPDGDSAALGHALRRVVGQGRLSEALRRRHRARFSWEAALPRILGDVL
jgi:glycosyltransferase involved in cell wall biosynthesis